ncbi:MAG: hypothetical protein JXB40_04475 [Candidatus Omnitrophica bacterium]|nr:hypothetical protein [Candidatus Omnitrophota bacterium]
MTEEKKEEKVQDQAAAKPAEKPAEKQAEAPQQAAEPAAAVTQAPPAKEEDKKAAPKPVRPDNCAGCKKSIKKKRWYYRDGLYYCTKRCWNISTKKSAKKEEAPAAN